MDDYTRRKRADLLGIFFLFVIFYLFLFAIFIGNRLTTWQIATLVLFFSFFGTALCAFTCRL